jgi:hypothetical protein
MLAIAAEGTVEWTQKQEKGRKKTIQKHTA